MLHVDSLPSSTLCFLHYLPFSKAKEKNAKKCKLVLSGVIFPKQPPVSAPPVRRRRRRSRKWLRGARMWTWHSAAAVPLNVRSSDTETGLATNTPGRRRLHFAGSLGHRVPPRFIPKQRTTPDHLPHFGGRFRFWRRSPRPGFNRGSLGSLLRRLMLPDAT